MTNRSFGVVLLAAVVALGCAHSRLAGEAEEFAAAGRHKLACERALQSLRMEPGYTRSVMVLATSAPIVVERGLEKARGERDAKQFDAALGRLDRLGDFASRVQKHGVELDAAGVRRLADETRKRAAQHHYAAAEDLYARDRLKEAIARYLQAEGYVPQFRQGPERRAEAHYRLAVGEERASDLRGAIRHYEAAFEATHDYRDTREKLARANYRLGKDALARKRHRSGVEFLDAAQKWVPGYKDAAALSARAMDAAIVRVAILPLENRTNSSVPGVSLRDLLYDQTLRVLGERKSRFLQIIDRDSLDLILAEHGFSGSEHFDPSTLPRGGLAGVTYLVTGRITQLTAHEEGPRRREVRQAFSVPIYEQVLKKSKGGNTYTENVWKGNANATAVYTDVSQSSALTVRGSMKLLDVRTARVVKTVPFEFERSDAAHFAENLRKIAPYGALDRDVEKNYPSEIRALTRGQRTVASLPSLANRAASSIASSATTAILGRLDAPAVAAPPR